MKKTLYFSLVIFLAFVMISSINNTGFFDDRSHSYTNLEREPYTKPPELVVTLIITYSDDNTVTYDTKADEGDTAFNLLRTVSAKKNIEIETEVPNNDLLVKSIANIQNSKTHEWTYTVNGKESTEFPDKQLLSNEDSIEFVYQKK